MKSKNNRKKERKKKNVGTTQWKWQYVFAACSVFVIAFTYVLTIALHPEYVRMSADLNPFVASCEFFQESMRQAGGILAFTARYLQSFFYYPQLGISVLILIFIAIAFLLKKVFDVSARILPLCFLPALMLLLNYTQLGYMIYALKAPAPAMTLPLGTLMALLLCWAYKAFDKLWMRYALLAAILIVGYPLLGFFSLLAVILCLIIDFVALHKSPIKDKKALFTILSATAVAVLLAVIIPNFFFSRVFTLMPSHSLFTFPLPDYYWQGDEKLLWIPAGIALAVVLLLPILAKSEKKISGYVAIFVLLVAAFAVFKHTYNNPNFSNILKMSLATDNAEWEKVVDVARDSEVPPTRVEVLFRNLALQKLGTASDAMFKFEDGDADYVSPRQYQYLRLIAARALYYYYGKVNYAYRWCMEDMVEYGMRPAYAEYMLRCAIVNEEPLLAEKYRNILSKMPFRSDNLGYYSPKDESSAMPLGKMMNYNDLLDGDAGLIEVYILNNFALTDGGSREMVELSLQCNMILKDIAGFWHKFLQLLPTFQGKIPLHYQEAAILFAALEQKYDISQLPLDSDVKSRFERLVQESSANSSLGDEENARRLKPSFGDSYWYYYFFVKGLKTN